MTLIDWDAWRTSYPTTTLPEQHQFYKRMVAQHPDQPHANLDQIQAFLEETRPETVIDIGGWDGRTAAFCLDRCDSITTWRNLEIAPGVPQVCDGPGYTYEVPDQWVWELDLEADALIASHVLEHMQAGQIQQLLARSTFLSIYADVPIPWDTRPNWTGYIGTHILDLSWAELDALFTRAGYRCTGRYETAGWYQKP